MALTRSAAAIILLLALLGLGLNFAALHSSTGSTVSAIWILLRYFTITTNLLVAFVFARITLSGAASTHPRLMGATVLSILLVGIVYAVLLSGQHQLSGGSLIADVLLHRITPIAVPLFWLGLVRKGLLGSRDPLLWALYPLGYFAYASIRGSIEQHYAYPFMDATLLGWSRVMLNSAVMAIGFFAVGWLLVWLDRRLAPDLAARHTIGNT